MAFLARRCAIAAGGVGGWASLPASRGVLGGLSFGVGLRPVLQSATQRAPLVLAAAAAARGPAVRPAGTLVAALRAPAAEPGGGLRPLWARGFATRSRSERDRANQRRRRRRRRQPSPARGVGKEWFGYLRDVGLPANAARAVERRFLQHSVPFPCLEVLQYRVLRNRFGVRKNDARAIARTARADLRAAAAARAAERRRRARSRSQEERTARASTGGRGERRERAEEGAGEQGAADGDTDHRGGQQSSGERGRQRRQGSAKAEGKRRRQEAEEAEKAKRANRRERRASKAERRADRERRRRQRTEARQRRWAEWEEPAEGYSAGETGGGSAGGEAWWDAWGKDPGSAWRESQQQQAEGWERHRAQWRRRQQRAHGNGRSRNGHQNGHGNGQPRAAGLRRDASTISALADLGLERGWIGSESELRRAFNRKALEYHPDTADPELPPTLAAAKFRAAQDAFQLLKPKLRA